MGSTDINHNAEFFNIISQYRAKMCSLTQLVNEYQLPHGSKHVTSEARQLIQCTRKHVGQLTPKQLISIALCAT